MSDYLLLTDKKQCPKCQRNYAPAYLPGQCRNCGMQLFSVTDNFVAFEEETGWREYWVWTGMAKGWKHRTQVFAERALSRVVEEEKLDADYGSQDYINRKIDDSRIELRDALKKKKRKPTSRKVYHDIIP
jgi:predicted amidophosphoribosyltransferase